MSQPESGPNHIPPVPGITAKLFLVGGHAKQGKNDAEHLAPLKTVSDDDMISGSTETTIAHHAFPVRSEVLDRDAEIRRISRCRSTIVSKPGPTLLESRTPSWLSPPDPVACPLTVSMCSESPSELGSINMSTAHPTPQPHPDLPSHPIPVAPGSYSPMQTPLPGL